MAFLEQIEHIFHIFVEYGILFLELAGVVVLLWTAGKSLYTLISKKPSHIQLDLARGIALALEFKLGGEVLRTVIVREQSELLVLGAIIVLRGALTFLIHWEIKNEETNLRKEIARREKVRNNLPRESEED